MTKTCTKCGEMKEDGGFGKRTSAKDGKNEWCKACARKSAASYSARNPEKVREANRIHKAKRRLENPEHDKAIQKRWYEKHKTEHQKRRKRYVAENRFTYALKDSAKRAAKFGYKPCNATPQELQDAFTGRCAICGVPEIELTQRLHVDHDHATGAFRGYLCGKHNRMLGYADDEINILRAGIQYLEKQTKLTQTGVPLPSNIAILMTQSSSLSRT